MSFYPAVIDDFVLGIVGPIMTALESLSFLGVNSHVVKLDFIVSIGLHQLTQHIRLI